jgi:hypothetical protein
VDLTPRQSRVRAVVAAALLVLLLLAVRVTVTAGVPNEARWRLLGLIGVCWLLFAGAAWALLRTPRRVAMPLLLLGAVGLQLVAVSVAPRMTDDFFRYAWDGRVQAAGIDPYRYPPTDPALAGLRDEWLFPPGGDCVVDPRGCTRMNHPTSPTIYPPVAQAGFWLLHVATAPLGPDGGGARPLQVAAAALALATTGALILVLRRTGGDPRRAVLWAWCPSVVLEAGNNAHVDVLAAFLVVLALGWSARGRAVRAGLALGAAIATKLLPVLLVPALAAPLRVRPGGRPVVSAVAVRTGAAAAVVLVLGYLPHVVAVGPRALGFLPGYLGEEGFDGSSGRFALLTPWLPGPVATVVAVLIVAGTAARVAWSGDPARPWLGGTVLVGVTFAVVGLTYPWYALLPVVLVALGGRAEWLVVAIAGYPAYFAAALHTPYGVSQRLGFGVALAVVAAVALGRRVTARRHLTASSAGEPASPGSRPDTTPDAVAATVTTGPAPRPPAR